MSSPADFATAFDEASKLHAAGRLADAEQRYLELAGGSAAAQRESVLRALVGLYLQSGRPQQAVDLLATMTGESPDNFRNYVDLATLLDRLGNPEAAIDQYERLLARQPGLAAAHFNLALLYKRVLRYRDAIEAYGNALRLGIDNVQEVYSNIGVVHAEMRQPAAAREMYERALGVDAAYVPALFNLATLHEEAGERQQAIDLYDKILGGNPRHWDSLARLAHAHSADSADDPLIDRLRTAAAQAADEPLAREGLYFALGKMLDDVGQYAGALDAYRTANALGRQRLPRYDRHNTEQGFDGLMKLFDRDWIASRATALAAGPVFVCGLFRSGSTLVEQMLGSHPAVTAAGELDFMPSLIARKLAPYPQRAGEASAAELQRIAEAYLAGVGGLFPGAQTVTDKRPDNFLHLGLIGAMFPGAKIVYTRRRMADNCLSMYFQQLGGSLAYSTDLADTAHYYRQHDRLMRHWMECLGAGIHTVDYDELVQAPEPVLRGLLEFLGLEWDDRCLQFESTGQPVRTASVWQVRQGLHSGSSGRWQHYAPLIENFDSLFAPDERGN